MTIYIVHHKRSALRLENVQYLGRPSELGNPYTHLRSTNRAEYQVDTVEEAIRCYGFHFYNNLMTWYASRREFKRLVDIYRRDGVLYLSCWCKDELDPRPHDHGCHCDIVREAIYFTMPTLNIINGIANSLTAADYSLVNKPNGCEP